MGQPQWQEERAEPRDETWRRVRVSDAAGVRSPMLIVNLSPNGLMARSDEPVTVGHRLTFSLPEAGTIAAEVRWSLGGRIGCRFERTIPRALYPQTVVAMR